jgi:hypothetical protein
MVDEKTHDTAEHEHVVEHQPKQDALGYHRSEEDSLTMTHIWKNHKAIIGWSFYWALCAIGW